MSANNRNEYGLPKAVWIALTAVSALFAAFCLYAIYDSLSTYGGEGIGLAIAAGAGAALAGAAVWFCSRRIAGGSRRTNR